MDGWLISINTMETNLFVQKANQALFEFQLSVNKASFRAPQVA